jgi:2-polyprenyl-3-methyl-5-hydroxy-6-metoxy-1,4-benzoquinol methylase
MAAPTRWVTDTAENHSEMYIERFRSMAAAGDDLAGEARLVDAMVPRGAHLLDAGCGPGRVGGELHQRGHRVVGVDADPKLIAAAEQDHPGPRWLVGDLAELDLAADGETELFNAAVLAGNVVLFVAPGTETAVLRHVAAHVKPDGFVIVGFHVNRALALVDFDRYVDDAGLTIEHRFATWDLRAWHDAADFAVTVLRHPQPQS